MPETQFDIKSAVHSLRVEIDKVIQTAQQRQSDIGRADGGREIALVVTKLQEGKMWAGKVLEALGSELPKQFQDKHEDTVMPKTSAPGKE